MTAVINRIREVAVVRRNNRTDWIMVATMLLLSGFGLLMIYSATRDNGTFSMERQMIFVTHNPNIPVLGDAERVFVLDSDGASARKANEGTVDQCKSDIVTLLEGGEDAFKARKCRYAY